jgi:hypothetical protein
MPHAFERWFAVDDHPTNLGGNCQTAYTVHDPARLRPAIATEIVVCNARAMRNLNGLQYVGSNTNGFWSHH